LHATPYVRDRHRAAVSASLEYRVAFVSTRGGDDDRPQLWVLPTDGGEARQVTNVAGGVRGIEWSPDGTRIAFVQEVTAADRDHASPSWGDGNTLYYTVNIGEPDPEDTTEYAIVAADRQAGEADADDG